ncbi:MAG TPA: 16S rRNA (uracil(1498)-N(3))-methyltransferase [Homoserinimonas sp.]|nr:16S rRNA (uracil(1498)-N(3))-methyltransferase [Homoserinimonas sp.]
MAHFYLNEHFGTAEVGSRVSLEGAEARHAVSVSRVQVGESLRIGNGSGLVVTGTVEVATPQELSLLVETVDEIAAASPAVWLAQALAKGDRDEMAVQAATELGVDGVIPWASQRSIVKWEGAKVRKGHDRWSAIVREASKQSMRPWIPEVADLASTKVLCSLAAEARMLVLDPQAELPLSGVRPDGRDLVLVVGPEGGISDSELEQFVRAGAEPVSLGTPVLRTSTAGPAAIAVLNTALGRW